MRLVLHDESRIRRVAGTGDNLEIDGGEKHADFLPLHTPATSIAICATVP